MFDVYLSDRRNHLLLGCDGTTDFDQSAIRAPKGRRCLPGSFHGEGVAQHLDDPGMPDKVSNRLCAFRRQRLIGAGRQQGELPDNGRRQDALGGR